MTSTSLPEARVGASCDFDSRLESFGFSAHFAAHFAPYLEAGFEPGRVALEHRGAFIVLTKHDDVAAELSGTVRHEAASRLDLPAVGDWVALRRLDSGRAVIHALLPRRTAFVRAVAGGQTDGQIVAANVDVVLLVAALDGDVNLRRLERYLALAHASLAAPVVVLTKADLARDVPAAIAAVRAVTSRAGGGREAGGSIPIHVVSAANGAGVDALQVHFAEHRTVALLGSSGAGKSTLVNGLVGATRLATAPLGADGRGRHTTTHRELVVLPSGGLVLDTPGMRELRLWDAGDGLDATFADVAALAAYCRYRDCTHDAEPGCAVRVALHGGALDAARWASYEKLQREAASLAVRQDARRAAEAKRGTKALMRAAREHGRRKGAYGGRHD